MVKRETSLPDWIGHKVGEHPMLPKYPPTRQGDAMRERDEREAVTRLDRRFDAMDPKWHRFMAETAQRYPGADHG